MIGNILLVTKLRFEIYPDVIKYSHHTYFWTTLLPKFLLSQDLNVKSNLKHYHMKKVF